MHTVFPSNQTYGFHEKRDPRWDIIETKVYILQVILQAVSGHSIWIRLDSFVDRSFDCDKDNIYIPYVVMLVKYTL